MIADDLFTTPGDSNDRQPGDFRRNSQGKPLVKHPTGQRDLAYDRPSSWIGDDYTGIDPVFARRGSWVHRLTEHIDNGVAWAADLAFVADGVALGIPADIQQDIAQAWLRFKTAHGLEIVHVECNVVNDNLRVAGTLDRIVTHDGCHRVLDLKTGGKVDKTGYAVQLARYATSIPYDVDTDTRGTWDGDIDHNVGVIAHLPLNDILKGSTGVEFQLVEVALHPTAINAAERLRELLDLNLGECFHQIAAPSTSSPSVDVEQPGGGDGQRTAATAAPPPTLDLLRDMAKARAVDDPEFTSRLVAYFDRNGTDTTNPEQVAEAIDAVTNFHDVATAPSPAPTPTPATPRPDNTHPDEGPPIPDGDFTALSNIYRDYPKPARDWIAEVGIEAKRAGLDFHTKGHRTTRRFHIMRALINLSDHPDRDTVVDRLLRDIHGDTLADHNTVGILIGALNHHQAVIFADAATEATA